MPRNQLGHHVRHAEKGQSKQHITKKIFPVVTYSEHLSDHSHTWDLPRTDQT